MLGDDFRVADKGAGGAGRQTAGRLLIIMVSIDMSPEGIPGPCRKFTQ